MAGNGANSISTMLTPPEVAARLGVEPERVIRWIRTGKLPAINLSDGKLRPRFRVDPLDLALLEQRRAVVPAPKPIRRRRQSADVIEFFR